MATKSKKKKKKSVSKAAPNASNLVIVESPAKARAIGGYLGPEYRVEASVGHVRDLPRKELGVDPSAGFEPTYQIIHGKKKVLSQIAKAAKGVSAVYVATDPDREGEAIAWHIVDELGIEPEIVQRALFYEITPTAVRKAIETPGKIDLRKVDAQQARRILDRLVGYEISPILAGPFYPGLSAGRVQTVALRLVCEREEEIERFERVPYWRVRAVLAAPRGQEPESFVADLRKVAGRAVNPKGQPREADFRPPALSTEEDAAAVVERAQASEWRATAVERKERSRSAPPPFTTSTLQQDASRRLGFSARRTMSVAQRLYEGVDVGGQQVGLITYMRTDATRVSQAALSEVRELIASRFGNEYRPEQPRRFKSSAGAQEAHEAIRPTAAARDPEEVRALVQSQRDGHDMARLYELIWLRFVASQMEPARYDRTTVDFVVDGDLEFRASGSVLTFPGFIEAYRQAGKRGEAGDDVLLPAIDENEQVDPIEVKSEARETQPPARYSDASLVKELEARGIGRPSTYATIISRLFERNYAERVEKRICPTVLGRFVLRYLVHHFDDIFEVDFTRGLEEELDRIEEGELPWRQVVEDLWKPLRQDIDRVSNQNGDEEPAADWIDLHPPECPKDSAHGAMRMRWNRFGPFWGCREYPDCRGTAPIPELGPEPPEEPCPVDGGELTIKRGRRGPFVGCTNYPECDFTMNIGDDPKAAFAARQRAKEAEEDLDRACPECDEGRLSVRSGRFGSFIGCSRYPKCRYTESLPTGITCPECGEGNLVERRAGKGKRGRRFYGCSRYPDCEYTQNGAPRAEKCPACGHVVAEEYRGRDGEPGGLRCPKCKTEVPEPTAASPAESPSAS